MFLPLRGHGGKSERKMSPRSKEYWRRFRALWDGHDLHPFVGCRVPNRAALFAAASVILIASRALCAGTLSVKVVDENGSLTPARVYLTDAKGREYFAPNTIKYIKIWGTYSEQFFVPSEGKFTIRLGPGKYSIEIDRGKEYLPVKDTLFVSSDEDLRRTYHLTRWVHMADFGWYSGDMHVHSPLRNVSALMEAEDLNIALPITLWRLGAGPVHRDPELEQYLEKADRGGNIRVGTNRWFPLISEELEAPASSLIISDIGRHPLPLTYPMVQTALAARTRGAAADLEKPTALELPVIAALGGNNFVGLASNHFWRYGCFLGAWGAWPDLVLRHYRGTCFGFAVAGFQMYYALLDMGFPLKLSAGSAYGVHPVPVGWSRVYAHVRGQFTVRKWFDALKQGRSFVTTGTGAMLLLRVNGLEPGNQYGVSQFPFKVAVDVDLLSPIPPSTAADVIVNGSVYPLQLAQMQGSKYTYQGKISFSLGTSSWIAARWVGTEDGHFSFAHTAPVYLENRRSPTPIPHRSARYFIGRVQSLINEIQGSKAEKSTGFNGMVIPNAAVRQKTLNYLDQALQVYRAKLRQSW